MPFFATPLLWSLGAAFIARLIVKEWRRVNDDLDRMSAAPATEPDPGALPRLRRDPATGVYRP